MNVRDIHYVFRNDQLISIGYNRFGQLFLVGNLAMVVLDQCFSQLPSTVLKDGGPILFEVLRGIQNLKGHRWCCPLREAILSYAAS